MTLLILQTTRVTRKNPFMAKMAAIFQFILLLTTTAATTTAATTTTTTKSFPARMMSLLSIEWAL
jgi:hypothetical protein